MSAEITTYRAKVQCHVGGLYRRAGDEFALPTLNHVPDHLEEVKPSARAVADDSKVEGEKAAAAPKAKTGKGATVADDSKVEKADLGIGEVKSASDVTSSDMLNK